MENASYFDDSLGFREFQGDDINELGRTAGLADDHVFASLLPMAPFDGTQIAKGTLAATTPIVVPSSAALTVLVRPFRGFIGSRSSASLGDAAANLLNFRDIRSAVYVGAGSTDEPLSTAIALAANASGNARIDTLYAAVIVDFLFGATRYYRDRSGNVAARILPTSLRTSIELRIATGTPAVSPVAPAVPADGFVRTDSGVEYYVPLAQIRVANGAGVLSSIDVVDVAPRVFMQVPISAEIFAALVTGSLAIGNGGLLTAQAGSLNTFAAGSVTNFSGSQTFDGSNAFDKIGFGYRTVARDATLNSTRTITIADGPIVDGSGITTGRTWTLDPTGAAHGQVITLLNNSTTNAITLHVTLPAPIGATTISLWRNAGNTWSETFIFDSNAGAFQQLQSSPT